MSAQPHHQQGGTAEPASGGAGADVVVVGGGVIGLAIAWRASRRGLATVLVDPSPGAGASRAAAGMLAPVTELHYGEEPLLRLNLASAARYPSFVAELEDAAHGTPVGYRDEGTLAVALDPDDRAVLDDLRAFQVSLGLDAEVLTGREARRLEPMLAPTVRGALHVRSDHSVDNRRLTIALHVAVQSSGVDLRPGRVAGLVVRGDRAAGVQLADGTVLESDAVVLASGAHAGGLPGLPDDVLPPVRPVKGQILRLRVPSSFGGPLITRTVRGFVRGAGVYLVPRADGELVVGATSEEQGFDTRVTAGGVYELLRDAHELVPALTELELAETTAALRPGTPDNAPLLGTSALPGLVLATGHYRNGILLTPVTADAIAELLVTGELPEVARPFDPRRFAAHAAPTEGAR